MKPARVVYRRPESLEEALGSLRAHAADARTLAPGQSLVLLLNFRLARPSLVVDIDRLSGPGLD